MEALRVVDRLEELRLQPLLLSILGSSRWLKHVCAEGSRLSSVPFLEITKFRLPNPLIGTLSDPVQKKRKRFCRSTGSS